MLLTSLGVLAGATVLGNNNFFESENGKTEVNKNINNAFSLVGKCAVVTGAARGIGRAIAGALANAGQI